MYVCVCIYIYTYTYTYLQVVDESNEWEEESGDFADDPEGLPESLRFPEDMFVEQVLAYLSTCIHAYVHTCMHACIQTDRQTDRNTYT